MLLNTLFRHWSYRIFASGSILRQTYDAFKELLEQDALSHDRMAELEILYHEGRKEDFSRIRSRYTAFAEAVQAMVKSLEHLRPVDASLLRQYFTKFDFYVRFILAPPEEDTGEPFVLPLRNITTPDNCGNKAYNLALLKNTLQAPVPDGFAITTNAFYRLLEYNQLRDPIDALLAQVNIEDPDGLAEISAALQEKILNAKIPPEVSSSILHAFDAMVDEESPLPVVARSSAISEDGEHSFAGQYHTVLGVYRESLLDAYLEVVASKYSAEALLYRIVLGLTDEETPIGVLVMEMVDARTSGVLYTINPSEESRQEEMLLHSIYGLGDPLVSGAASADCIQIERGKRNAFTKTGGGQQKKLINQQGKLVEADLTAEERGVLSVSDTMIAQLQEWGEQIAEFYQEEQDIEWAEDRGGALLLLQSRPLHGEKKIEQEKDGPQIEGEPLFTAGQKASGGMAQGKVHLATEEKLETLDHGVVLVTRTTPPSLVRYMDRLRAVVADYGSTAGHFATVCREFGIPLIVATKNATAVLQHGQTVLVHADSVSVYPAQEIDIEQSVTTAVPDTPYYKKLKAMMAFITPLKLVDPLSPDFKPSSCRSLHDIIRYTHEQAVQAMFSLGDKISAHAAKELHSDLPLDVKLLDVGGGICKKAAGVEKITEQSLCCKPFIHLWQGLTNPGVDWEEHSHFDWKTFDDVAMAGGVMTKKSGSLASYAIISDSYLNFNMRFGYHFTLVDSLFTEDKRTSYCQIRFAGGGGQYTGRSLRIDFLVQVLERLGFEVHTRADLLDAKISGLDHDALGDALDMLGRLLGATKLMDMVLRREEDVGRCVEQFFAGRYTFTATSE